MDWLNLHTSILDSNEFLGCDPVERATWLCLLRYCIGQENGGRIEGAVAWGDRKWQQIARVTLAEASTSCRLWSVDGSDVVVWAYPMAKEIEVKKNREDGKKGGRPKGSGSKPNNPPVIPPVPEKEPPGVTEGERKGNGKEKEGERDPSPDGTPDWKLNKAESYRREIADHRLVVDRLEAIPADKIRPEAKTKLDQARADIRALETKIFGFGLKP